jgi:Fe-Mn family superoxide dismutase
MKLALPFALALALAAGAALAAQPEPGPGKPPSQPLRVQEAVTIYEPMSWPYIEKGLPGLSAKELKAHYGLYEGYVKKINEIQEKLKDADRSGANYSYNYYSELKRRQAVPLMGTYLHEAYFENLSPQPLEEGSALAQAMKRDFGSLDAWWEDARAVCLSAGVGWCVTAYNTREGHLHNYLITEHHIGYPAHVRPIVVIDSWEHAFCIDYGTDRGKYLEAVRKLINWKVAQGRYDKAAKE